MNFLHCKIIGTSKKLKDQPRPLFLGQVLYIFAKIFEIYLMRQSL
jgi:hypothetical protein